MPEPTKEQARVTICQSCGMPLEGVEEFGTAATGERVGDYCYHCYRNGSFTEPHLTKEQMIHKVGSFLVHTQNIPENAALLIARRTVSRLKRWLDGFAG